MDILHPVYRRWRAASPFALPALAIAGLHARDIMGYCLVILLLVGAVVSLGLYLFPG